MSLFDERAEAAAQTALEDEVDRYLRIGRPLHAPKILRAGVANLDQEGLTTTVARALHEAEEAGCQDLADQARAVLIALGLVRP